MQEMEARSFLVGARKREQFRFAVQFSEKRQAGGSSRAAGILEIAGVVIWRLGCVAAAQTVGQNHGGVSGGIRNHQLFPAGRRADYVEIFEHLCDGIPRPPPPTPGLNVIPRGVKEATSDKT